MEESSKDMLLKMIIKCNKSKKHKVKKVEKPVLTVEGLESSIIQAEIQTKSYSGEKSYRLRQNLRKLSNTETD